MLLSHFGFCPCCNQPTRFEIKSEWLRDNYLCCNCGSIPRERALMFCLEKFYPTWNTLIIHESSPGDRGASIRLRNDAGGYIPSHYFPGQPLGSMISGFRNENLEELTFHDNSIDLHITQDVFEHILDPEKAFKEIARTLKPGGAHIFTTPLVNKTNPTRLCARKDIHGNIEQLIFPKEYHGNPISKEGSLVTVHWGYDINKYVFNSCGLFTEMVYIDSIDFGIRAEYIEVLITRK